MKTFLTKFRSFDRPSQVLMVNQFSINVGFYMLMPYLAGYLAAHWAWRRGRSVWSSACATSPNKGCSCSAVPSPTGSDTNP